MDDQLQKIKTEYRVHDGLLMYENQRHLIISCPWFAALQLGLENTLGDMGAATLVTSAARTWGTRMLKMYTPLVKGMHFEEKIKYIIQTYNTAGWGLAELIEFQTDPARIVIKKTQPYYKDRYKGSADGPRCYLYLGVTRIIEGLAKAEGFPELETTETKCIAKGDPHCEFVLEPSSLG
ncbi:MAG: V4R domain-containing protein [Promethearchaeota archaeon]